MAKPRVLIFIGAYLPGYKMGGPLRSVSAMVEALGDAFDFSIVTGDRDVGEVQPYPNIVPGIWVAMGKARVLYLHNSANRPWPLLRAVRQVRPHAILCSSFFDRPTMWLCALRALGLIRRVPLAIAPRGEFSQGALGLKGRAKRLYIGLFRAVGLPGRASWLVSSAQEGADLQSALGGAAAARAIVVPDMAAPSGLPTTARVPKEHGTAHVVLLARIARMKNIDFALDALALCRNRVCFSVVGPLEDEAYWAECMTKAAYLPENVELRYLGPVPIAEVTDTLAGNDLMLLPTRGENFGHAILEALQAGVPVLISDRTPWLHLEETGAGWALPLTNPQAYADVIDAVALWDEAAAAPHRSAARDYGRAKVSDPLSTQATQSALNRVLGEGE